MDRKEFRELLEDYISDGFTTVEIELRGNRSLIVDCERDRINFAAGYFWFGGDGVSTSIDYRVIKSVAI